MEVLPNNTFVMHSDVKSYYASIDHQVLMGQLRQQINEEPLLMLLYDYMQRRICQGSVYLTIRRGISLSSSLSPLMGVLCLSAPDERLAETGLTYIRFMDDWVILAPTR